MTAASVQFCDVCKKDTERCQYYPVGRRRQHAKCLECDRNDIRNVRAHLTHDKRYCTECDRIHTAGPQHP